MPIPPTKPLFDDDDTEHTEASQPGDLPPGFGDADDEATQIEKPGSRTFEDDEKTVLDQNKRR